MGRLVRKAYRPPNVRDFFPNFEENAQNPFSLQEFEVLPFVTCNREEETKKTSFPVFWLVEAILVTSFLLLKL